MAAMLSLKQLELKKRRLVKKKEKYETSLKTTKENLQVINEAIKEAKKTNPDCEKPARGRKPKGAEPAATTEIA